MTTSDKAAQPLTAEELAGCAQIRLSSGLITIVSLCDFAALAQFKWAEHRTSHHIYASRSTWIGGKRRNIKMHRAILEAPDGVPVDHINGNGLDNRRSNLRLCDQSTNNRHRNLGQVKNKYGFKCLRFAERCLKPWRIQFKYHAKRVNLGQYATRQEAAMAYDAFALDHFHEGFTPNPASAYERAEMEDRNVG